MAGDTSDPGSNLPTAPSPGNNTRRSGWFRRGRSWQGYLASLLLVAFVTAIGTLLLHRIDPANLAMLYLIVVILAGLYFGRRATIFASLLSALAFDYFLIEPRFTMTVADTQYLITFIGLLAVGLVVSYSIALVKEQLEKLRLSEAHARALNALSRDLTAAQGLDEVLIALLNNLSTALSRNGVVLLAENEQLSERAVTSGFQLTADEMDLARSCFADGRETGRGTNMQTEARVRFIPLHSATRLLGVLGVAPAEPQKYLSSEQRQLLDGFASLAALGIERARFVEQAERTEMLQATERLQSALLNSVSHDLRTPLAGIAGVLSTLKEFEEDPEHQGLDRATRQELLDTAWDEVERLNRYVGNLLEMTRLESGVLRLRREVVDVQDFIGAVVQQMRERLKAHQVKLNISVNLPPILIDFLLFSQVMVNLLDNAIKYSPAGSLIEVSARQEGSMIEISVLDRGAGVPQQDLSKVFDKFYRVQRPSVVSGTGLGLAISKGIVEAHGGRIWAENREGGGTVLNLTLPAVESEVR